MLFFNSIIYEQNFGFYKLYVEVKKMQMLQLRTGPNKKYRKNDILDFVHQSTFQSANLIVINKLTNRLQENFSWQVRGIVFDMTSAADIFYRKTFFSLFDLSHDFMTSLFKEIYYAIRKVISKRKKDSQ